MMKRKKPLLTYKKAFSLMEVIIAITLLSVVMLSLIQIKSNNIFMLEKSTQEKKNKEYLLLALDTKENKNRNENINMDKFFNIQDDDLRKEFKEVKINIKDEILDTQEYKNDDFSLKVSEYKTSYSFENGIKKDIYRFKLEL